jgi:hypothetical protein
MQKMNIGKTRKNVGIIIAILIVAIILICAWAPWLTEDYAKDKVLDYFNQKYGFNKSEIKITAVEKRPFEMHFGLSFSVSDHGLPHQSSVHSWVTFYGQVKHDEFISTE